MIPRLNTTQGQSMRWRARIAGHSHNSKRGVSTVAVSRLPAVVASCRLVLRPTGSGSFEHIGDETPLPQAIPLKEGVFEVGRTSPADIQIPIPTVSSRHALLRVEDNKVLITDLNSTNGTMVNGQELGPLDNAEVEIGGEIIFGDMYLAKFQLDEVPDHVVAELYKQQHEAALSDQASVHEPIHPNNITLSS